MRTLLAIAAVSLLCACNVVTTKAPLFVKADAEHGAKLRPGVWAAQPSGDCALDEKQPLPSWPNCANGFVVVDDGTIAGYEQKDGKPVWSTAEALVAGGDPLIFQIHLVSDTSMGAMTPEGYIYAGMEPTKRDDQGRVVATTSWAVMCGPPPPSDTKAPNGDPRMGTLKPFDGLIMDAQGNDCTTDSKDVLRAAARASHKITPAEQLSAMHWVRDGRE